MTKNKKTTTELSPAAKWLWEQSNKKACTDLIIYVSKEGWNAYAKLFPATYKELK